MDDENSASGFSPRYQFLVDHCAARGLKFRADPENKGITLSVRGDAALYEVVLLLTHDDAVFQVYVVVPVAPGNEKLRPLVAEFVARANHSLVLGNFDFNMDDGRLCYHVGHALGEAGLDETIVGRLLGTSLGTVDRYFPALMRVLFGGHTPADAVYLSELDYHTGPEEPAGGSGPAPAAEPKPETGKKPRRSRKNSGKKPTEDLPGLFDRGGDDLPADQEPPPCEGE